MDELQNRDPPAGGRSYESRFQTENGKEARQDPHYQTSGSSAQSYSGSCEVDYPEDCDFSDAVLRYISDILMEEQIEDELFMLQDSLELRTAERSFYDVLGEKYPPSPEKHSSAYTSFNEKQPYHDVIFHRANWSCTNSNSSGLTTSDSSTSDIRGTAVSALSRLSHSPSSSSLVSPVSSVLDSHDSCGFQQNQFVCQYTKATNEARDFLPRNAELFANSGAQQHTEEDNQERGLRRKNLAGQERLQDERSNKQPAVYEESILRSETFDIVLLSSGIGKGYGTFLDLRASFKDGVAKNIRQQERSNGSKCRKARKKKQRENELVDVRGLLIQCAQAVASHDSRSANELLGQITRYASPFGDGTQRLAHCFADGLEARLAGTGSQIYRGLVNKRRTAAEMLKAYQLYLAACPFQRTSNYVSNTIILRAAENTMRIHVIDFGILYGFQWPTLIQLLSNRLIGPPKLRITGIDFPQPGFRPAAGVEETGRRLADYAHSFNVPFEYNAVAKNWEDIHVEELKIDREEFLIVNCMYRFKNLFDETVMEESSRDSVLNLIRKIEPALFIHGVVNGTHNAPFFVTRFREALFHFSALFDMIDTIVPRENLERMVIEKDLFGWEALNSIACEGWERVERPETYKQWQVRNMRAGFKQVPLDQIVVQTAIHRVVSYYHKDFVIDEVNKWLLQGWKGRFLYALSTWKPA